MDVGNKENLEGEKKIENSVNYPTPQLPPDCRFGGGNYVSSSMGMVVTDNNNPMADSYDAVVWDHHGNSQPYSSLSQIGLAVSSSWQDPAFIERAARFSCFSSGIISELINSFPMNQPVSSYHRLRSVPYGPQKNETNPPSTPKGESKQTESDEADSVGGCGKDKNSLMDTGNEPSLSKGVGHKKRRRAAGQDNEPEQSRQLTSEDANDNHKQSSPTTKTSVSEPQKEEYIHVRARRGQATNSHSLAERIRREKISERMKYLQDLVPGCSKVTGKAVMLDEIINYVQSLQRQVEFLSMKLASIDPKVEFNIDSLLAKEQLFPTLAGPSSSMGFSLEVPMVYPSVHPHLATSMMNQGYKESTQEVILV